MMGQPGVQKPRYRPGESMEGRGSGQGSWPGDGVALAVMFASLLRCELERGEICLQEGGGLEGESRDAGCGP